MEQRETSADLPSEGEIWNRTLREQIIAYLISGAAYFTAGYTFFFFAYSLAGWPLWQAKLTDNLVGWTINFILQRYWVFLSSRLSGHLRRVTGRYLLITIVDFALDLLIVSKLKQAGLTPYLGQFVSAACLSFWNFLWYRLWVFAG